MASNLCLLSVMIFSFGCACNNDILTKGFAVDATKLLTIQTGIGIDSMGSGSAKTMVGKGCPDGTL
jgi:hypothetical protein